MSSAYYYPLIFLPVIIAAPGNYLTRGGETVTISSVSERHDHGCLGTYSDGILDRWHKSGRIYADVDSLNDIVKFLA